MTGSPSDCCATRVLSTSSSNSHGSSENAESTPPSTRYSVTCFSITVAPSATAAMAAPIPIV